MKNSAPNKKLREKSKTRAWEKERRDRLSETFEQLKLVLPNYDASKKLSKIEILLVATSTIKDFGEKVKKLLVSPKNENGEEEQQKLKVSADIIKKLEDRVKKLLVRNEELANLLKHAGIHVPSVFGPVKKIGRVFKHSNKVTSLQAKILQKQLEKENQIKPPRSAKPKKPKLIVESKHKRVPPPTSKLSKSIKRQLTNLVSSSNCVFIVSQPPIVNNSCYIVAKSPRKINQTVLANSLLVKAPIVSSNIKSSVLSTNPPLATLGPGTLVFANGTVMPVLPTPPLLPAIPTIFSNPIQTKLPTLIVVSSNNKTISTNKTSESVTKFTSKPSAQSLDSVNKVSKLSEKVTSRPPIRPKACVTRTTQINKVPIPALSSRYNSHLCLDSLKTRDTVKKVNLVNLKSEGNIHSENNLKTQLDKRKTVEISQQEPKKHKSNIEKDSNMANTIPAADAEPKRQLPNLSDSESHSCSIHSGKFTSGVKGKKTEKKDECDKPVEEPNKHIKASESSSPVLCENPTVTTQPLQDQAFNGSKATNVHSFNAATVDINTCEISKPNKVAEYHNIKDVLTIVESKKNNSEEIQENAQAMSDRKVIAGCVPLVSVELTESFNSAVTTTCNKPEVKISEINISESESVTKNSNTNDLKTLEINLPQSELSNDIFASFQVPPGCQNPGSTSPTAAFLLAFPLVSSGIKVTEVIGDENSESHAGTPNLLQIGTMEITKPTQTYSDSLTPNILSFDNFSFFSNKDNCGEFYNNCSIVSTSCQTSTTNSIMSSSRTASTLNKSATVPAQNISNLGDHTINSKLNTPNNFTFVPGNRTEINNTKTSNNNNFKTVMSEKVSTNIKMSSSVNSHHEQLRSVKALEVQSYISNGCSFNRNSDGRNVTANLLDMNINAFSLKLASNENYANKPNVSGQVLVAKSSNTTTNYPNYRDCSSFVTNSAVFNKNYNSVYTSTASNDYFYNPSGSEGEDRHFNPSNCNNYSDYRKIESYNNYSEKSQVYHKDKFNQNMQPKMKPSSTQNKPINWMTAPSTTISYKPDYFLPPFSKEHNFNPNLSTNSTFAMPSNTYFNTSSVYNPTDTLNSTPEIRKTVDVNLPTYNSYQRTENEENQFSWSPNKIPQFLDPTHSHTFVSSTLPTLVGDLALNNTPIPEQKTTKDIRTNQRKVGGCENQSVPTNFLSVSQLVDHNQEHVPAKVVSRRNSGNRSKTNTPKTKRVGNRSDTNKDIPSYQKNDKVHQHKHYDISVATNLFNEAKQPTNNKTIPSSYSAEALIGNQLSSESTKRNVENQNKSIVPNFLSDNIVSYFPAIDVSQDNGYAQTNQSFQANTFSQNFTTTFQNNTYGPNNFIPSACTLASTYIPNNNFMHSSNNQEFLGETPHIFSNSNNAQTKDKNNHMKNCYRQPDKIEKNQAYNCKKAKKRSINESCLSSFDIPFLSMPGTINSPILPDDFHTTYLPPTTLYSCKNPLYSKPNPEITPSTLIPSLSAIPGSKLGIQHSEMSPSVNSVGTSLTNFNLSTIFPEINKGPVQKNFSDPRSKEYFSVSKNFSVPSSLQVPFSSKSSIPFGTFGT